MPRNRLLHHGTPLQHKLNFSRLQLWMHSEFSKSLMKKPVVLELEWECQDLINSFSDWGLHGENNIRNRKLLSTYKNWMFCDLLHGHCQPHFYLNNAEGKHCLSAYCSLAIGQYIDPNQVQLLPRPLSPNDILCKTE